MKTIFCTIWLGPGEPKTYSYMIESFLANTQDKVVVFTDSQTVTEQEQKSVYAALSKLASQYPHRLTIIDVHQIAPIKNHAYYHWIINEPSKKHFAQASDCLRFLVIDYLLNPSNELMNVFFFEADVELKSPLNFKNLNNNNIISFTNDETYAALYCPNTSAVKTAIKHVCKTYDNIGKYVFSAALKIPFSKWKKNWFTPFSIEEDPDNILGLYLTELIYKEDWQAPSIERQNEVTKFSQSETAKREWQIFLDANEEIPLKDTNLSYVVFAQFSDLYGIDFAEQIDIFKNLLVVFENNFIIHWDSNKFVLKNIDPQNPQSFPLFYGNFFANPITPEQNLFSLNCEFG